MGTDAPSLDPDQSGAWLDEWRADPVQYVEEALGWKPTPWQADALRAVALPGVTAIKSGHGIGKSALAAAVAQWAPSVFPSCVVVTTAPTDRQVRGIVWKEFASQQQRAPIPLGAEINQKEFKLSAECYGYGVSTDDPNRFQGTHGVGSKEWGLAEDDPTRPVVVVIVDEAAGMDRGIMEALSTITTGPLDRIFAIGNATDGESYFAKWFQPGSRARTFTVSSITAAAFAAEHGIPGLCSLRQIEEWREDWGEGSPNWLGRVLGEFPTEAEDSCIKLAWVEAAVERWRALEEAGQDPRSVAEHPQAIGVDVARGGGDAATWAIRSGVRCWVHARKVALGPTGTMAVAGETLALRQTTAIQAIAVDDTGLGGGVTDRLREQGVYVQAVNFGSSPVHGEQLPDGTAKCRNRRAELWWRGREALRLGHAIVPPDERLRGDLTAVRYWLASNGQIQLESKDDVRKRLGRSPDDADAWLLAWDGADAEAIADPLPARGRAKPVGGPIDQLVGNWIR